MKDTYADIKKEVGKVIVGQEDVLEQLMIAIFTDNHALLEGFPGLGKTMMVRTLASIMDLKFRRIQCTPDLMPSDVTGTYIVEEDASGRKKFRFEEGPVFTNILLADEINRATPKSQSSLLESMQERQVTMGNTTHKLDRPFFVLATQNPLEMEGTYPLPEAQVDRFLLKIMVDYPNIQEEDKIVELYSGEFTPLVNKLMKREHVLAIQDLTKKMPISGEVREYALRIVAATRPKGKNAAAQFLDYGASPRASIGLVLASKARALLQGRNYVAKEDIKATAFPVLRHRIILNFESERKGMSSDDVITQILKEV
ncbi:MAG: AAA domain-containing protein [Candidatus Altiarchaeales archaeon]|nr:AAA domain-containing protein [Candidatus Altiarchaeales archaeon]MBD3415886.1 AAA domain-containing protein [Candidatus Altiarchaeales archaeon]